MLHSHALFTAKAAPRSPRVRTVGSAESVMPVGLTDADDADDAIYHGDAFYCATEHISVTILEPMSKSHMASEGDPQVALAASQASTRGQRGDSPPYPTSSHNEPEAHLDCAFGRSTDCEPEPKRSALNSRWDGTSLSAAEKANAESKWDDGPRPKKELFMRRGTEVTKMPDEVPSLSSTAVPALQVVIPPISSNYNEIPGSDITELAHSLTVDVPKFLDQNHGLNSNPTVGSGDQPHEPPLFQKVFEGGYSPRQTKPTKERHVFGLSSSDESSSGAPSPVPQMPEDDLTYSPTESLADSPTESDCFPTTKLYDVVQEAFAEPIRPRPLVACATRLSSQQPPRVWTPEEARQAHNFHEFMLMKREHNCRGLFSDMEVPSCDGSSIDTLPRHDMSNAHSEPTSDRRPSNKGATSETTGQPLLANGGDPSPCPFATYTTARPSMPMPECAVKPCSHLDLVTCYQSLNSNLFHFNELKAYLRVST
jgi:hypothetical protein